MKRVLVVTKLFVAFVTYFFSLYLWCYVFVKKVWLGWTLGWKVFDKEENNTWNRCWLELCCFSPVYPLYRNCLIHLLCKSVDWFISNGNTGLKRYGGSIVKINVKLKIFFIVSSSKRNVKLQKGIQMHTAFRRGMM